MPQKTHDLQLEGLALEGFDVTAGGAQVESLTGGYGLPSAASGHRSCVSCCSGCGAATPFDDPS